MAIDVSDEVFVSFLEAALFEDEQLPLGPTLDPSDVARTADLAHATVLACISRLVAQSLGYVRDDDPNGFSSTTSE